MKFWQNQLNFVVWCATTGCGVDFNNHLNSQSKMIGSLFKFHVYYQTRRLLKEMSISVPQDSSWNAFDNDYNTGAYERICKEFQVDPNTDLRQKRSDNQGLGTIYWGITRLGDRPVKGADWDFERYSFTEETKNGIIHIDYIAQNPGFAVNKNGEDISNVWSTFIIEKAKGFTKAGIERINESIRTYCWAILGSQSQTRTDIFGTCTSFDAQKQFIANIEDSINSPVDLPSQIERYQNTLKYARSKVDFVFGIGLYMAPSNMELRIGTVQDYNNEIIIATTAQRLGLNNNVNTKSVPPKPETFEGGIPTKPPPNFIQTARQTAANVVQTAKQKIEQHKDNKKH